VKWIPTFPYISDMKSAITFDTHAAVKELEAAGFSEQQAEVLTRQQSRLIEEELATKRDLKEMEQRITIRLGGMIVALGAFVAAIKFFR